MTGGDGWLMRTKEVNHDDDGDGVDALKGLKCMLV